MVILVCQEALKVMGYEKLMNENSSMSRDHRPIPGRARQKEEQCATGEPGGAFEETAKFAADCEKDQDDHCRQYQTGETLGKDCNSSQETQCPPANFERRV